jgi:polyisoprenoid-binding protein YceI
MAKKAFAIGIVLVLIAVGTVAYSFLRPPQEASGPIEAIPVAVDEPVTADPTPARATAEPEPTNAPPTTEPAEAEVSESVSPSGDDAAAVIFEIVQADSEVRFVIDEILNGAPKTVVGVTDQVAAEIAITIDDPSQTKIGTILVNARALATDSEFRNRAIKNRILSTDDYEFVTFTPTELIGLPDSAAVGESFTFQIRGDLTVRDVTQPVTFDATVTPDSEDRLMGNATTTILYADFGLSIPEAPAVAGVEDEVRLEIDFVAVAK